MPVSILPISRGRLAEPDGDLIDSKIEFSLPPREYALAGRLLAEAVTDAERDGRSDRRCVGFRVAHRWSGPSVNRPGNWPASDPARRHCAQQRPVCSASAGTNPATKAPTSA